MNAGLIARRYATVLYDYAAEQGETQQVYADARNVAASLLESNAALSFLASPLRKPSEKKTFLASVFGSSVCASTLRFMNFTADKGRESLLCEILRVFGIVYRKRLGIRSASVVTATQLSAQKQKDFAAMLEDKTQSKVEVEYATNADLIGGIVVEIDGKQIDCSVKNQLKEIERKLMV